MLTDLEMLREELRVARTSSIVHLLVSANKAQKIAPNPEEWVKTIALIRSELAKRRGRERPRRQR